MSPKTGASALKTFRLEVSKAKQLEVLQAVEELANDSSKLTIAGISRAAKVSRQFIHSHPHLRHAVQEAGKQAKITKAASMPQDGGESVRGLQADRATLLACIERQRSQISEQQARLGKFEDQRKRWLGSQLPNLKIIDPEVHAELHLTKERLMSENGTLKRKIAELRQILDVARADLAASRAGWAEDIDRFTGDNQHVVPLVRAKGEKA